MSRPWISVGVFVTALLLGVAIAGWPDRHQDAPLAVQSQAVSTTQVESTMPAPTAAAALAPSTAPADPVRPPANVKVIAFNASGVPGSAGRVSSRLKTQGYAVGPAGPDRKPAQPNTVVQFRPGSENEAKALATGLGLDAGVTKAVQGTPEGWGSAEVAVVIGSELAARV